MDNLDIHQILNDNNDALKYILRNQLAMITMFIDVSVVVFAALYCFMVIFDIKIIESLVVVMFFYLFMFRFEVLRVLTLFQTLKILSIVDTKSILWNITEDENRKTLTGHPIKSLNCHYDNIIKTIKPINDFETINMEPLLAK